MRHGDVTRAAAVVLVVIGMVSCASRPPLLQNQAPPKPQAAQPPQGGNQTPGTPGNQTASGNKTPAKPAEPPPPSGAPLYISPGIVQHVQQKLLALGYPVPTVSGAWGDNSAAALAKFQQKMGLDPGE